MRPAFVTALLLAPILALASLAARGADPHATLAAFSQGLRGLEGRFSQQVFDADGRRTEDSSGTLALAVPRQFRWEYDVPFPQLIVADGSKV